MTEYPRKFKNADGTINVDNLLKSYLALEKHLGRQAERAVNPALMFHNVDFQERYNHELKFREHIRKNHPRIYGKAKTALGEPRV